MQHASCLDGTHQCSLPPQSSLPVLVAVFIGLSLMASIPTVLVQHVPPFPSNRESKMSVLHFFPTTYRKNNVTCSKLPDLTYQKAVFCLVVCVMADGIFAILSPSHITNMIVTVCHNDWLTAVLVLLCWWYFCHLAAENRIVKRGFLTIWMAFTGIYNSPWRLRGTATSLFLTLTSTRGQMAEPWHLPRSYWRKHLPEP